ncbi:hypothetical protein [Streptomyces sp. enrichment culture]
MAGETLNTPEEPPESSRNFWMFRWSGVRHSERAAQCVPSWMSDQ